jgi:hypothetical protein
MIKKLTSFLDYGLFAEAALTIFAVVFVAVVIRTLMMSKTETSRHAHIVLEDNKETRV